MFFNHKLFSQRILIAGIFALAAATLCAPQIMKAQAGIGIRGLIVEPVASTPFILGRSTALDFSYWASVSHNNRLHGRATLGIVGFDIRFPDVPTYGLRSSGNQFTVLHGQTKQELFRVGHASIGLDYNVVMTPRFRAYAGIDGSVGLYHSVFFSEVSETSTGNRDVSEAIYGGRFRVGMAYSFLDRIELFSEMNYAYFAYPGLGWWGFADLGVGLRYLMQE